MEDWCVWQEGVIIFLLIIEWQELLYFFWLFNGRSYCISYDYLITGVIVFPLINEWKGLLYFFWL